MEYVATLFNQETTYHKYTEIQIVDDGFGSLCLLDLAPPTFLWALGSHMPNRRLKCSVKWSIHVHCSFFCLKFYCLRWHHCFSLFYSLWRNWCRFTLHINRIDLLACTFVFPIQTTWRYPRELLLSSIALFTCARAARFLKGQKQFPLRASRGLNWVNKTYKLKRYIVRTETK